MRNNYNRSGSNFGQAASAPLEAWVHAARMGGVCTDFGTLKVSAEPRKVASFSGDNGSLPSALNDHRFGGRNV
jgi:hypothetical protein